MVTERSQRTRRKLLEAAELLVMREGVSRLTLEAVAEEAGMSKGSLLYHFPSKDDLVRAMISRLVERFESGVKENRDDAESGSWTRGYARATFGWSEEGEDIAVQAALLAAMANDPALVDPLREKYEVWQRHIEEDGLDPALATLLRMAADGMWMSALFGLAPPDAEFRKRVLDVLIKLTGEHT